MAGGINQKLKLLYLADIFRRRTDEDHMLTLPELIDLLQDNGIEVERKTGRDAVDDASERGTVGFAESCDAEQGAEGVGAHFEITFVSRTRSMRSIASSTGRTSGSSSTASAAARKTGRRAL